VIGNRKTYYLLLITYYLFNDVCDAQLDAVERPERPIPSGRASLSGAIALGTILLFLGIIAAAMVSRGNLLLGVSAVVGAVSDRWYLALIPIIYIAAITAISQGEVHGGKKTTGIVAIALVSIVITSILSLGVLSEYRLLITLPFLALFTVLVLPPFIKAAANPTPELIQLAVKAGILSLIVLDASISAGFSNWIYGLSVLALLPLSRFLGRMFAVT